MTFHQNCLTFLLPKIDDLCVGPKMANYSNGHSSEMGPYPPPQKIAPQLYMLLHIYANLWLKIPKFGGQKNLTTFWHLKNPKKLALFGPANDQSVTYSKIQTKVCRVSKGTPMDWSLIKSVNAEYPLSCHKCVEKQDILCSMPHWTP